jgi:hypothetical protein
MPIQMDYETPATGAHAMYHVVQKVDLDRVSNMTTAVVSSYLSVDAKSAGKHPIYTQQIQVSGLPAKGQDAFDFSEAELVAPAPASQPPQPAAPFIGVNRYLFAGAAIVD